MLLDVNKDALPTSFALFRLCSLFLASRSWRTQLFHISFC